MHVPFYGVQLRDWWKAGSNYTDRGFVCEPRGMRPPSIKLLMSRRMYGSVITYPLSYSSFRNPQGMSPNR
jgi:hypothetical protein